MECLISKPLPAEQVGWVSLAVAPVSVVAGMAALVLGMLAYGFELDQSALSWVALEL